jgi:hypothetical protein
MNKFLFLLLIVAMGCSRTTYPDLPPEIVPGQMIVGLKAEADIDEFIRSWKRVKFTADKMLSKEMNMWKVSYKTRWHPTRVLEAVKAHEMVINAQHFQNVNHRGPNR